MNKRWLFIAFVAAMMLVSLIQRRQSTVSPAEEAAVARLAWLTDFETARARSRAENKPLLIDFTGSDWCPPCMRLRKEVFSKPEFAGYAAKNLVLLEVDFPRRRPLPPAQQAANDALAQQFGIDGFPTIVLIDPAGETLARLGYTRGGAAAFIAEVERVRARPGVSPTGSAAGLELRDLALEVGMEPGADEGAKIEHHAVGDGVEDLHPVFAAAQDAGIAKQAQMLGRIGLRGAGRFHELGDVALAVVERLEQPQPHRLGQQFEAGGHEVERLGREGGRRGFSRHDPI